MNECVKGRDVEENTRGILQNLGAKMKENIKIRDRILDFLVKTPEGGQVAVEVKDRKIGIPDVLSIASVASYLGSKEMPATTMGTILTTEMPQEAVLETAAANAVAVVVSKDCSMFSSALSFITNFVDTEIIVSKLGKKMVPTSTKLPSFTDSLDALRFANTINADTYNHLANIYSLRNDLVHGEGNADELQRAVTTMKSVNQEMSSKL